MFELESTIENWDLSLHPKSCRFIACTELVEVSIPEDLAPLTAKKRSRLKSSSFVYPGERRYPIHDVAHARNALAMVAAHGTPVEKKRVQRAVKRKYPGVGG